MYIALVNPFYVRNCRLCTSTISNKSIERSIRCLRRNVYANISMSLGFRCRLYSDWSFVLAVLKARPEMGVPFLLCIWMLHCNYVAFYSTTTILERLVIVLFSHVPGHSLVDLKGHNIYKWVTKMISWVWASKLMNYLVQYGLFHTIHIRN